MTTLLRLSMAAAAFLALASSPSLGEVARGHWQIREPDESTFLQFVHDEEEVYLSLYCSKKGSTRVEVSTQVGTALVKAGQKVPLTLDWEGKMSVTMDVRLNPTPEDRRLEGYVGLREVGLVLTKVDSGALAIKVRGVEERLPVDKLSTLAARFVRRCN